MPFYGPPRVKWNSIADDADEPTAPNNAEN